MRQFVTGVTFEEFANDKMRYFAVMKNIEIIGEAANMLTRNFRMNHPDLPRSHRPENKGSRRFVNSL